MKLNNLIKDFRFDKRIVKWGVRYKTITYQEYEDYLKSLDDLSDEKESIIDIDPESEENSEEK